MARTLARQTKTPGREDIALGRIRRSDRRYQIVRLAIILGLLVVAGYSLFVIHRKIDSLVSRADYLVNQAIQEGKTRDREVVSYMTCFFTIPIEERDQEVIERCFEESDLPGGLERDDFSPVVLDRSEPTFNPSDEELETEPPRHPQTTPSEVSSTQSPTNPTTSSTSPSILMSIIQFLSELL